MKILVISLTQSVQRRARIRSQLNALGLRFEFLNAISGVEAHRHIPHYDDTEFIRNCGRSATANEIGCFASHRAVWRECVAAGEPIAVLEDDARVGGGFGEGLRVVADHIERLGLLRLSVPESHSNYRVECAGDFEIRYCRRVPLLAVGYSLSPHAASRLLANSNIVREPVDKFLQRFWIHGQDPHALHPPIVELDDVANLSDIGERSRPGYSLSVWARRLLRKTENSIRRDLYVVRKLLRGRVPGRQQDDAGTRRYQTQR